MICPVCRKTFMTDSSSALPFCSARCKQLDLGRWFNEAYSVPILRDEEEGEEPPVVNDEEE